MSHPIGFMNGNWKGGDRLDEVIKQPLSEQRQIEIRINTCVGALCNHQQGTEIYTRLETRLLAAEAELIELLNYQNEEAPVEGYKDRFVPGIVCPNCGAKLIVKERHLRQRGLNDYVTGFISCCQWERTGCKYNQPFTNMIRAAIDEAQKILESQPADF